MKRFRIELKWALFLSFLTLLWAFFEKTMGWHDQLIAFHPLYTNVFLIPAGFLYFMALQDKKRRDFSGNMNYTEGFISGIILSIIAALISPLTTWLSYSVISPDYLSNMIRQVVSAGRMEEEAAKTFFSMRNTIIQGLLSQPMIGFVISGVVAYFVRTKK